MVVRLLPQLPLRNPSKLALTDCKWRKYGDRCKGYLDNLLQRLVNSLTKVNFLYCHQPDPKTPLAEQAAALNDQYKRGRFSAARA